MPNFAPWYRREDYALVREIMDDGDALPLTFDEWEKNAESERGAAKREGVSIIPVFVDPDEFFTFCKEKKISPNVRPPQHSPVAEGRRATLWVCEPVSLHVSATRRVPFDYRAVRSSGSPAARQRNVKSKTPSSALKPVLVELLSTKSFLESRAQCWLAADTAASLAGAEKLSLPAL
jgi:hypothetical protein